MLVSTHYIDSIVANKRGIRGCIGKSSVNLRGYKFIEDYVCPFTNRKGAYVKIKKVKNKKYIDAYFIF